MQEVIGTSGFISFARRFTPVFNIFLGIIVVSLVLALGAMELLSAARSYVAMESLWSKAQRDAVHALTLYAHTRDPQHYRDFETVLSVPLNDRAARLEMDKPYYDYDRAYAFFLAGSNHAKDIPGMIRFYRCCSDYFHFDRAVEIWRDADVHIDQLQHLGVELKKEISSRTPSSRQIGALLEKLKEADSAVKPLELAFIATLGESVRWLKSTLAVFLSTTITILIILGVYLSSRILRQIRQAEENYHLLADAFAHTADGIMILDRERRILAVNHAFTTITGYAPTEVVGRKFKRPQTIKIPGPTLHSIWADTRYSGRWEGEMWNVRKNGELYPMRLNLSAVYDRRRGAIAHYVGVFNDISLHKANEERLKHLATHDSLTGLPNRAELKRYCHEAIERARRFNKYVSVLYIDLDNFKPVNDTHGHQVGDELLKAVSQRMKQMMRETDVVARIGGDEFCVLLADLDDASNGYVVACKLLDLLSQPVPSKWGELPVGASIGVSTYPNDGEDPQTLLRLADAAMYRVKQGGRSGVGMHSVEPALLPLPMPERRLASQR